VVESSGIDDHESGEIVSIRSVISMPGNHIERRMVLFSLEEFPLIFSHHCEIAVAVFKGSDGIFKISWAGEAIGTCEFTKGWIIGNFLIQRGGEGKGKETNGSKIWKFKVSIENLAHVSSRGTIRNLNPEEDSPLDHANMIGRDLEVSKLSLDDQGSLLRNFEKECNFYQEASKAKSGRRERDTNEKISIGIVKSLINHVGVGRVDMNGKAIASLDRSCATNGGNSLHKVHLRIILGEIKGAPAQLIGGGFAFLKLVGQQSHFDRGIRGMAN